MKGITIINGVTTCQCKFSDLQSTVLVLAIYREGLSEEEILKVVEFCAQEFLDRMSDIFDIPKMTAYGTVAVNGHVYEVRYIECDQLSFG